MVRPHVCYAALVAAPWLALAGAGTALCGLLLCGRPGLAVNGAAALVAASGAWLLAWGLLWAQVQRVHAS